MAELPLMLVIEDEYFPPPPELREMLKAITALVDLILQTPASTKANGHTDADREFTAAEVLSAFSR